MADFKGTPGPWAVLLPDFDEAKEEWDDGIDSKDRVHQVARLSAPGWTDFASVVVCVQGEPDDDGLANSLLITHSLDLLAACREVVMCDSLDWVFARDRFKQVCATAIAKATGGA